MVDLWRQQRGITDALLLEFLTVLPEEVRFNSRIVVSVSGEMDEKALFSLRSVTQITYASCTPSISPSRVRSLRSGLQSCSQTMLPSCCSSPWNSCKSHVGREGWQRAFHTHSLIHEHIHIVSTSATSAENVFRCLHSWLKSNDISVQHLANHPIVGLTFQALRSEDLFEVACDLLCQLIKEAGNVEEGGSGAALAAEIMAGLEAAQDLVAAACSEDEDDDEDRQRVLGIGRGVCVPGMLHIHTHTYTLHRT